MSKRLEFCWSLSVAFCIKQSCQVGTSTKNGLVSPWNICYAPETLTRYCIVQETSAIRPKHLLPRPMSLSRNLVRLLQLCAPKQLHAKHINDSHWCLERLRSKGSAVWLFFMHPPSSISEFLQMDRWRSCFLIPIPILSQTRSCWLSL